MDDPAGLGLGSFLLLLSGGAVLHDLTSQGIELGLGGGLVDLELGGGLLTTLGQGGLEVGGGTGGVGPLLLVDRLALLPTRSCVALGGVAFLVGGPARVGEDAGAFRVGVAPALLGVLIGFVALLDGGLVGELADVLGLGLGLLAQLLGLQVGELQDLADPGAEMGEGRRPTGPFSSAVSA